jgi:hypothetical protein
MTKPTVTAQMVEAAIKAKALYWHETRAPDIVEGDAMRAALTAAIEASGLVEENARLRAEAEGKETEILELIGQREELQARIKEMNDKVIVHDQLLHSLKKLPETCKFQTAIFLFLAADRMGFDYWSVGKDLQMKHGIEKVFCQTEAEIGNGIWSVIRQALIRGPSHDQ